MNVTGSLLRKLTITLIASVLFIQISLAESSTPRSAKNIYEGSCAVCHAEGIAGAPRFQNKEDWDKRKAQGIDKLVKQALEGLNAMPAKGNCMECSDTEIKSAIEYMMSK